MTSMRRATPRGLPLPGAVGAGSILEVARRTIVAALDPEAIIPTMIRELKTTSIGSMF